MIFTFFLLLVEKNASKMTEVKKKKKYVIIKMNSSKIKKIKKKEVPKIDINLKQIKKPTNKISKKNSPKKIVTVKKIVKKKIEKKEKKVLKKKAPKKKIIEKKIVKKEPIKKEIIKEPKKLEGKVIPIKKVAKKEIPKKDSREDKKVVIQEIVTQEVIEQKIEKEVPIENIKKIESEIVTGSEIILDDLNKKGVEYEILKKYYPEYPETAKEIGFEAEVSVVAKALIGVDGRIEEIEIIEGLENFGFNKAVEETLKYWRFTPIKLNGKIVRAYFVTKFEFRLEEE